MRDPSLAFDTRRVDLIQLRARKHAIHTSWQWYLQFSAEITKRNTWHKISAIAFRLTTFGIKFIVLKAVKHSRNFTHTHILAPNYGFNITNHPLFHKSKNNIKITCLIAFKRTTHRALDPTITLSAYCTPKQTIAGCMPDDGVLQQNAWLCYHEVAE